MTSLGMIAASYVGALLLSYMRFKRKAEHGDKEHFLRYFANTLMASVLEVAVLGWQGRFKQARALHALEATLSAHLGAALEHARATEARSEPPSATKATPPKKPVVWPAKAQLAPTFTWVAESAC